MVMAAAEGIVRAHDRSLLAENDGDIKITTTWAISLLSRMGYVKRKATTKSTPGMSEDRFLQMKSRFLKQISSTVILRDIPDKLVLNLDQTGIKIIPLSEWTMAAKGSRRVDVVGLGVKQQITATFVACLDGTFMTVLSVSV